jgi:hypothetical protein
MLADHDWLVLLVVPEADFISFVTDSSLVALAMSVVIVAIIVGLAGLLGWRNLVAGRRVAIAALRQRALEERARALIEVGRRMSDRTAPQAGLQTATETAAEACGAKSVAIWLLSQDRRVLSCKDYYERDAKYHSARPAIHRDEVPALFAALDDGALIDTVGAPTDQRAVDLAASYLRPLRIDEIYIAPIMVGREPIGMVSVEDPQGGEQAAGVAAFCNALAILLALKLAGESPAAEESLSKAGEKAADSEPPANASLSDAFSHRKAQLEQTLVHTNSWLESLRANSIPRAAVGIVKLPEWTAVAGRPPDSGARTEMDAMVRQIRSVIDRSDLSYAAQFDDEIVIAAYSEDEATAAKDAGSVARALLEMRDLLTRLEERWGATLHFRFAIDVGTVMKSDFGAALSTVNLWGGAIGIAKALAASATQHTVMASETAQELLSGEFLLRPHGSYFLPEAGDIKTFVLAGRH